MSARSNLRLSLVGTASASPRFRPVVSIPHGKLGIGRPSAPVLYMQRGEAAALLADKRRPKAVACAAALAAAFPGVLGLDVDYLEEPAAY